MPPPPHLGLNAPPDDDSPQTNLPPSFPARFITVLDLYRAQRDTLSQAQAVPPSPTFRVQYQPDAPPVYHTLFAILSSQATVVAQEELDAIRVAVPSPPETPSPEDVLEVVSRILPVLSNEATTMSIHAMERVLAQSLEPNELELNDVPPEVWAALCTAVPVKGSSLNNSISRSSSFTEARESIHSGKSSPMDDSPTHTNNANLPLFLPGSSSLGQLSASYHPQSLEVEGPLPHVIGNQQHPISVNSSNTPDHQAITTHLANTPALLEVHEDCLTPAYSIPPEAYNTTLSLQSLASMPIRGNSIGIITGQND
ncbi:hypothetical protein V8E53_005512 [Lactarius tabidus]|jgi:hypothetical protein